MTFWYHLVSFGTDKAFQYHIRYDTDIKKILGSVTKILKKWRRKSSQKVPLESPIHIDSTSFETFNASNKHCFETAYLVKSAEIKLIKK